MFETGQRFRMIRRASASLCIGVSLSVAAAIPSSRASDILVGRAVLPAGPFAEGPSSGQQLGTDPINGQSVPFVNKQPVQGFSAIHDNGDGTFWVMEDNGYGAIENSADFNLRVYKIRPHFKTKNGGSGRIDIEGFIELHDPDNNVPFAITNEFTRRRRGLRYRVLSEKRKTEPFGSAMS